MTRLVWRRWVGRRPTGIDRVCLAYLAHFGERAQLVVQHRRFRRILDRNASRELADLLIGPRTDFRMAFILGALRWVLRRGCSGEGRLYLNVGHTGLNESGFRSWVKRADVRPIYFVHDLIPITHPEFCRDGEKAKHNARMLTVLTTGVGVIANSRATIQALADFARVEQVRPLPALPALLGSDAIEQRLPAAGQNAPPSFIVLGTIEARKNHIMLLKIWRRFAERLGKSAPRLLIIGQRGWECQHVFDLLDGDHALKDVATEIGGCGDVALAGHLANARALLFPSMIEGYGLPIVEALRSGTPVIASDLPVFREVAGDIPDYLDPRDEAAWEKAILSYSREGSAERQSQIERMAHYDPPTWDGHFAAVDAWLADM